MLKVCQTPLFACETAAPPTMSMLVFVQLSRDTFRLEGQVYSKFSQGIKVVGTTHGVWTCGRPKCILIAILPRTTSSPIITMLVFVQLSRITFRLEVQVYSKFPQGIKVAGNTHDGVWTCGQPKYILIVNFQEKPHHPSSLCWCLSSSLEIPLGWRCKATVSFLRESRW